MGSILVLVGFGLLILGGAAGVVLFLRAATMKPQSTYHHDEASGTLWGLFLIGLGAGIALIYYANGGRL